MVGLGAAKVTTLTAVEMALAATEEMARLTASSVMTRVVVVAAAVKLGIDWRVGMVVSGDGVDTTDAADAGAGAVATTDSAESAAVIGPGVTPARLAAVLLFSDVVSVDDDRSVSAAAPRLLRLPDAVDDVCASTVSRTGVLTFATLADVAAALDADAREACLLLAELFEAGDECAELLFAGLPGDDDDESEEPASAAATPHPVASATPTPRKTASPPTRPTNPDALIIRPDPQTASQQRFIVLSGRLFDSLRKNQVSGVNSHSSTAGQRGQR